MRLKLIGAFALCSLATVAASDATRAEKVCEYRPSYLLGDSGAAVTAVALSTVASTGPMATAAGFYTLVHAGSGLTMIGSTMAGASAAGTVGIIGGTAGAAGTAAAVAMNPFVWIPAAIAALGSISLEAGCAFLVDERVTDFEGVLNVMREFERTADTARFKLYDDVIDPYIELIDEEGVKTYRVENLYIVEGMLMHRDFAKNTKIGRIVLVQPDIAAVQE